MILLQAEFHKTQAIIWRGSNPYRIKSTRCNPPNNPLRRVIIKNCPQLASKLKTFTQQTPTNRSLTCVINNS